jgi:hypothetical protein
MCRVLFEWPHTTVRFWSWSVDAFPESKIRNVFGFQLDIHFCKQNKCLKELLEEYITLKNVLQMYLTNQIIFFCVFLTIIKQKIVVVNNELMMKKGTPKYQTKKNIIKQY